MSAKCKSCGAEIEWIKTKAGKNAPIDAKPVKVYIEAPDLIGHENRWILISAFTSHFATCPDADKFRRKKS